MVEEIISVDYKTKQNMKKIKECMEYANSQSEFPFECLDESSTLLDEVIKRMREFKK